MQTGNIVPPAADSLLAKAIAFVKSDPELAREIKNESQAIEAYQTAVLIRTVPSITMPDFAAAMQGDDYPLTFDDLR